MAASTATTAVSKTQVLHLYRAMLRAAGQFQSYNFRRYAVDRVQRGFREHQRETEPGQIAQLVDQAKRDLAMLRRQSVINRLYGGDRLVVE